MSVFKQIDSREREYKEAMAVVDANRPSFTLGPWGRDKYGKIIDSKGNSVPFRGVSIYCSGSRVEEAEKNSDLIAAAPDLLEACKRFIEYESAMNETDDVRGMLIYEDFSRMAREAIAKATGAA